MDNFREQIEKLIANGNYAEAVSQLSEWINRDPSMRLYQYAARRYETLTEHLRIDRVCRIAIVRSFSIEQIAPILTVKCYQTGIKPIIWMGGYNQWRQEILDKQSKLYEHKPDVVIIAIQLQDIAPKLWDAFLSLSHREVEVYIEDVLNEISVILEAFRQHSQSSILIHNFEVPAFPSAGILDWIQRMGPSEAIHCLNRRLAELGRTYQGIYLIDYEGLVSQYGKLNWRDERMWHLAKAPISGSYLQYLADAYLRILKPLSGIVRKCLVLDLDNTLWGGVIGEDGLEEIQLGPNYPGSAFVEFQKKILNFYNRGIILSINSKNNERDVWSVFDEHPFMVLKKEHFAAIRINWQDKVSNLKEIANELNIGLDSMVFVDDSPIECAFVRESLPEVKVIELLGNPLSYDNLLFEQGDFEALSLTEEDKQRGKYYVQQRQRREFKSTTRTLQKFLASLDLVVELIPFSEKILGRITQLTQRTNQFNLTTKRHTTQQIRDMHTSGNYFIFAANVKDKFGDNGITGLIILGKEADVLVIDTFLLSCRVIGLGVEQALLSFVGQVAQTAGANRIKGAYLPTAKNQLVEDFYSKFGFNLVSEKEGATFWEKACVPWDVVCPTWIDLKKL